MALELVGNKGLSSSDNVFISNGILLSLTIVFIKMVSAAVLVSPNSSQSLSKSFFNESSTLNVIVACAIIHIFSIANIILVDRFLDSLRSLEMTKGTFTRNSIGIFARNDNGTFARNDNGKRYGDGKSLK